MVFADYNSTQKVNTEKQVNKSVYFVKNPKDMDKIIEKAKTNKIEDVMNLVSQISLTENSDISLKKLKKEVEELYQRYKHL